MNVLSISLRTLALLALVLLGCKTDALKPEVGEPKVSTPTVTKPAITVPTGWQPLTDVTEPADVVLLLACEHPDFPSLIKVKSLPLNGQSLNDMVTAVITLRMTQGYQLLSMGEENGARFVDMALQKAGGALALQTMIFIPETIDAGRTFLVMGMWPIQENDRATTAFKSVLQQVAAQGSVR